MIKNEPISSQLKKTCILIWFHWKTYSIYKENITSLRREKCYIYERSGQSSTDYCSSLRLARGSHATAARRSPLQLLSLAFSISFTLRLLYRLNFSLTERQTSEFKVTAMARIFRVTKRYLLIRKYQQMRSTKNVTLFSSQDIWLIFTKN